MMRAALSALLALGFVQRSYGYHATAAAVSFTTDGEDDGDSEDCFCE